MHEHSKRVFFPHDILTGSEADGTVASGDATCHNWASTPAAHCSGTATSGQHRSDLEFVELSAPLERLPPRGAP